MSEGNTGCGICGGVILADTEEWPVRLCPEHFDVLKSQFAEWLCAVPKQRRVDPLLPSENTLATALPREMARVRDQVMPAYQLIGPAGHFALASMRADLDLALKAMAESDVHAMMRQLEKLRGYHT